MMVYTFDDEQYQTALNQAKEVTLEVLKDEGKITKEEYNNYMNNYCILVIKQNKFVHFCQNLFKKDDADNTSYLKMVKNA